MNTVVRPAGQDDLGELVDLCAEHARYEHAAFDPAGKHALLARALERDRLKLWVAESGSDLLGYAAATLEFSTWQAAEYVYLDCLFLRETARGHGLGRQLLHAVRAYARDAGASELQWQTPAWNARARAFYRRLGADESGKARFRWRI